MRHYKKDRYMMATKAIHMLGEVSRKPADLCIIDSEDKDNYYGCWVTGLGMINIKFPKKTTRELKPKEIKKYDGMGIEHSNGLRYRLKMTGDT